MKSKDEFVTIKMESPLVQKLNEEFQRRQLKNKRYSLRAYARSLEVDASNLLKILNGDRIPSLRGTKLLVAKLGLSEDESHAILDILSQTKSNAKLTSKKPFKQINPDILSTCSWQHLVLLEIIQFMKINEATVQVIADALHSSPAKIENALAELIGWGFISPTNGDFEIIHKNNTTFGLPVTPEGLRTIQRVFLKMASEAIDKYGLDERQSSTLTFAVNSQQIPEIKKILKKTRQKLNQISESTPGRKLNSVYNLTMALYPVFVKKS